MTPASRPRSRSVVAPDAARWIASVVIVAVLAAVCVPLGVIAGATGLTAVVLAVVLALAALGVLVWRRALLAIAFVALALTTGAVLGGAGKPLVDASAGDLVIAPTKPGELGGRTYRRGLGGVVADLRGVELRPGSTTHLRLRSDSGRVVVALRRDRCVAVRLKVTPLPPNSALEELANWTRAVGVGSVGQRQYVSGPWFTPGLFRLHHPDDLLALRDAGFVGREFSGTVASPGWVSTSQVFGRAPSRIVPDDFVSSRSHVHEYAPYSVVRDTRSSDPAVLDVDVVAAGPVVVRDYPIDRDVRQQSGAYGEPAAWPFDQPTTVSPELRPQIIRWPRRWTSALDSRAARARWARWEQTVVRENRRLARLQAGSCASAAALRDQWQVTRYGGETIGEATQYDARLIAVNGLGELVTAPAGAELASGSPQQLAARTGTRLLSPRDVQERVRQYALANLVADR